MTVYPNLRARYSKGTLKLSRRLKLPEGAEVQVTVIPLEAAPKRRKAKPKLKHPTHTVPWESLRAKEGIVSSGSDSLADGEALYDGD